MVTSEALAGGSFGSLHPGSGEITGLNSGHIGVTGEGEKPNFNQVVWKLSNNEFYYSFYIPVLRFKARGTD